MRGIETFFAASFERRVGRDQGAVFEYPDGIGEYRFTLPDPVLVASKLGLVGRDDPLVLQQMRFMFVKVRLDAS